MLVVQPELVTHGHSIHGGPGYVLYKIHPPPPKIQITLPRAYDVWPKYDTQANRIVSTVHEECIYLMYVVHN